MNINVANPIVPLIILGQALVGCSINNDPIAESKSLPTIRGSELQSFVAESELPVLVEFGVDYQCDRCRQMKQPVIQLGEKFDGRANVVRVDFNTNAQLVSQFGGAVCPTYVFFQQGRPVKTESFPISADLLASHLESMTDSPE